MKNNELLESDYQRAALLYSDAQPSYIGRLTLGLDMLAHPELDFGHVADIVTATLNKDRYETTSFCRTYGKLGVYMALDDQPTSFAIDPVDKYPKGTVAELKTTEEVKPSEFLRYKNSDSPLSFVLLDQPTQAEMAIIQALHMFDAAIRTGAVGAINIPRPLMFTADEENIVQLRSDNPTTLLRQYGNVRNRQGAPTLLGIALPTQFLEQSDVEVQELSPIQSFLKEKPKPKKVFMGITTTKQPHIGHGFLLAKALGEAGENGQVIVELNDQGPRVAAMVEKLAADLRKPFSEVADAITDGEIEPEVIEMAYMNREGKATQDLPTNFALTRSNVRYQRLISKLQPKPGSIVGITDSEVSRVLLPALENRDSYLPIFGSFDGAGVMCGNTKSVLVKSNGRPTVAGLVSALALQGDLTIVDSPPPLSKAQVTSLAENGINTKLETGIGVSIDFGVASGSKGNSLGFDELLSGLETGGLEPNQLVAVLRDMLEEAYFVPGDGGSLNPNFANIEVVRQRFQESVERVKSGQNNTAKLLEPLTFSNVSNGITISLLGLTHTMGMMPAVNTFKRFLEMFPSLSTKYSGKLMLALQEMTGGTVPKTSLTDQDRKILQGFSVAKPDLVFGLCLENYADKPELFEKNFGGTEIGYVARRMGYTVDQYPEFLDKLTKTKGIYATV